MAMQPIDRVKTKHVSKVSKRVKPELVQRSNKILVENVNSSHGPQITKDYWNSVMRQFKNWHS